MHQRAPKPKPAPAAVDDPPLWRSPTFGLALAGSLLLWCAFPPLSWWLLAWIAPLPWLWLILLPRLPGRQPYLAIWLAGFVHWLALLQGIRLAHPALYGGWLALSWYLAFYLPIFVALTRVAVHRLGISVVFAAPVVWVGLELIRGHLLTGFSLALLAHTQVPWPMLLQVSDLAGAYAVSFVVMFAAACLARVVPIEVMGSRPLPRTLNPALLAIGLIAAVLGYGAWRLNQPLPKSTSQPIRVALIQGSRDTKFIDDPREASNYFGQTFEEYQQLTTHARSDNQRLDLVVWPESMFVMPEQLIVEPVAGGTKENAEYDARFQAVLAGEAARVNVVASDGARQATPVCLLVGTNTWVFGPGAERRSYNSALLVQPDGKVVSRYYKMHAVMFGEYIPLGDLFPWIYRLTPMPGGLSVGDGPLAFTVSGLNLSPSICFESVVPHLIRDQIVQLGRQGQPPDVLVNVTNDGWFWGSAILELHFRCSIFRAIENRKPMIIAANTGISAWIDGSGRVLARGPRRDRQVLVADVTPDGRASPYHWIGDWPANLCGLACLVLAAIGWHTRRRAAAT